MIEVHKRMIVSPQDWVNEYHRIYIREMRNKTKRYFNMVNQGQILARDINEKRLFNATDLHYIKEMQKKL